MTKANEGEAQETEAQAQAQAQAQRNEAARLEREAAEKKLDEGPKLTVEVLAAKLGTPAWALAAAKAKANWPEGAEVTEARYKRTVEAAVNEEVK